MTTKNEYLDKLKCQLDEWQGDLEQLQAKAADAAGDVKAKYEAQMVELRAKLNEGQAKWEEFKDSADDLWDDVKEEAEEKWAALSKGFKESIEKVKSFFA
jgi:chromosome segregation ATPase